MGGRRKSRGKPNQQPADGQNRSGAGRGRAQQQSAPTPAESNRGRAPASFTPAPAPTTSAWGNPASPASSPWGKPAPAPQPSSSAWGNPAASVAAAAPQPSSSPWGNRAASVAAATPQPSSSPWGNRASSNLSAQPSSSQSAWGNAAPAPTTANSQSSLSSQGGAVPKVRPQQQPSQHPTSQSGQQNADQQPNTSREFGGQKGNSANSGDIGKRDRGSVRGRNPIPLTDILRTKPEKLNSKKGSEGTLIALTTNHFRLLRSPQWQIYQYRVDFAPLVDNERWRDGIIRRKKDLFGGYLFDGTMLFLTVKLPDDVTEFTVEGHNDTRILTTVKFVKTVPMTTAAAVQVLNLILRRSMSALDLKLVGRNFFDPAATKQLSEYKIELWPGYITSIRQHETDILMCAELVTKVIRNETAYDILQDCVNKNRDWTRAFQDKVLGMTVLTTYSNKTYRINDVDFTKNPMATFPRKDGTLISYVDYYQVKYGITIRDKRQTLLLHQSKDRDIRAGQSHFIALIPELCRATGFTERMRSDRRMMETVSEYTRLWPRSRIGRLKEFNSRIQNAAGSVDNFKSWNFGLDKNLVQLTGREITLEKLYFAGGKMYTTNQDVDWTKQYYTNAMYTSIPLKNWVVITPRQNIRATQDFIGVLQRAGNGMRYNIGNPHYEEMQDDVGSSYFNAIKHALRKDPQLIMCIIPKLSADKYALIKKQCCGEHPIPTQVMLSRTITPKPGKDLGSLMSVGTKVAIQMNAKLGGVPWMIDLPISGAMFVGFDVCHDTKTKQRSYGALVASIDLTKKQTFFSVVSAHDDDTELSNHFGLNMVKALQCYGHLHKALPDRIIIYRDGVGEGQTEYVLKHEVGSIKARLKQLYKEHPYRMSFIIVSKRINTRFFKGDENPRAGTVVDDVVTMPERYDWFLVSQKTTVGTASPTNYNVIEDTSGLSPNNQQRQIGLFGGYFHSPATVAFIGEAIVLSLSNLF